MTVTITAEDMRQQVEEATEDHHRTFDVQALTQAVIERYGLVDINTIDGDEFWRLAGYFAVGDGAEDEED